MKTLKTLGLSILALALAAPVALAAGGSSQPRNTPPTEAPKTPEEQAIDHYNQGIAIRDRAWKLEEKLASATEGKERDKTLKKLNKAWEGAIDEFRSATEKNPALYQAFSDLGYCLRKTGDYDSSLASYNRALALEPAYTEAIEYRAEAYLGLNRVEDAKKAYDELARRNRNHADELLQAMRKWVEKRRNDPAGVSVQTVNEVDRWIEQQATTAKDTTGHVLLDSKTW